MFQGYLCEDQRHVVSLQMCYHLLVDCFRDGSQGRILGSRVVVGGTGINGKWRNIVNGATRRIPWREEAEAAVLRKLCTVTPPHQN